MRKERPYVKVGQKYLDWRQEGKSSREACDLVREEFGITAQDVSIRSWAARSRPTSIGVKRRRVNTISLETSRISFRLLPDLLKLFQREADNKQMTTDSLLNVILMERYSKGKQPDFFGTPD
jgi:hypothetical protein